MRWRKDLYGQRLSRPHPDERSRATFAERASCIIMQNGLIEGLMSHRQPRCLPYIRTYSRIIFISVCDNKYQWRVYVCRCVPRLVTHRDDDDTVPRDSSRDSGFSSRPRKRSRDAGGGERRNRTRDYTLCALIRGSNLMVNGCDAFSLHG